MGEVLAMDHGNRSTDQELTARDFEKMGREIARLRRIERVANQILLQHASGNILPVSPLACQAIVDLGSLLLPKQLRHPQGG